MCLWRLRRVIQTHHVLNGLLTLCGIIPTCFSIFVCPPAQVSLVVRERTRPIYPVVPMPLVYYKSKRRSNKHNILSFCICTKFKGKWSKGYWYRIHFQITHQMGESRQKFNMATWAIWSRQSSVFAYSHTCATSGAPRKAKFSNAPWEKLDRENPNYTVTNVTDCLAYSHVVLVYMQMHTKWLHVQ